MASKFDPTSSAQSRRMRDGRQGRTMRGSALGVWLHAFGLEARRRGEESEEGRAQNDNGNGYVWLAF